MTTKGNHILAVIGLGLVSAVIFPKFTSLDGTSTLGQVSDNGDCTVEYDPDGKFDNLAAGEQAQDFFAYTASDPWGLTCRRQTSRSSHRHPVSGRYP